MSECIKHTDCAAYRRVQGGTPHGPGGYRRLLFARPIVKTRSAVRVALKTTTHVASAEVLSPPTVRAHT